jgi:hypothetical protein
MLLDPLPPHVASFLALCDANPSQSFDSFCASAIADVREHLLNQTGLRADARLPIEPLQVFLQRDPSPSLRMLGYRGCVENFCELVKIALREMSGGTRARARAMFEQFKEKAQRAPRLGGLGLVEAEELEGAEALAEQALSELEEQTPGGDEQARAMRAEMAVLMLSYKEQTADVSEAEMASVILEENLDPDVTDAIDEQVALLSLPLYPPSMLSGPVSTLSRIFTEMREKGGKLVVGRFHALRCIKPLMGVLPVLENSSFLVAADLLHLFSELGSPVPAALREPASQEAIAKVVLSVVAAPGNPASSANCANCSRARTVLELALLLQQTSEGGFEHTHKFVNDASFADVLCELPLLRERSERKTS